MNAIEHRLTTTVRELLETNRPAGCPPDFLIRAEQETATLEKPYLCIAAQDAGSPHPAMRKMLLTLTTTRRADDETTSPPEELHQRFINALESNLATLAAALASRQLRPLKMVLGETAEEIVAGRAESSSTAWTLWLLILPP